MLILVGVGDGDHGPRGEGSTGGSGAHCSLSQTTSSAMLADQALVHVDQTGHSDDGEIDGFFRDSRGLLLEHQNQKQLGDKKRISRLQ